MYSFFVGYYSVRLFPVQMHPLFNTLEQYTVELSTRLLEGASNLTDALSTILIGDVNTVMGALNVAGALILLGCTYVVSVHFARWTLKVFGAILELLLTVATFMIACAVVYIYIQN